jgi:flagellar hook protein FlgE
VANEISTVQSLKAVDAWIDVINANINGGVRTAYKTSRLKFGGNNANVARAGNTSSLPLQFPEPGLMAANTVIDFTQGAITTSTGNEHLAIQGDGFFLLATPDLLNLNTVSPNFGTTVSSTTGRLFVTRDGEFSTGANGLLRNKDGLYLVTPSVTIAGGGRNVFSYDTTILFSTSSGIAAVFNDLDVKPSPAATVVNLSNFIAGGPIFWANGMGPIGGVSNVLGISQGKQSMQYSQYGATVFDLGYHTPASVVTANQYDLNINIDPTASPKGNVLNKSLEASNASMTQSVPELSLAQKLFSALTKVLQISQTNTDAVINLIR